MYAQHSQTFQWFNLVFKDPAIRWWPAGMDNRNSSKSGDIGEFFSMKILCMNCTGFIYFWLPSGENSPKCLSGCHPWIQTLKTLNSYFRPLKTPYFSPWEIPQKNSITTLKNPISNPQKNPYFSSPKYPFQIPKKPHFNPQKFPLTPCFKPQKLYFNPPPPKNPISTPQKPSFKPPKILISDPKKTLFQTFEKPKSRWHNNKKNQNHES